MEENSWRRERIFVVEMDENAARKKASQVEGGEVGLDYFQHYTKSRARLNLNQISTMSSVVANAA